VLFTNKLLSDQLEKKFAVLFEVVGRVNWFGTPQKFWTFFGFCLLAKYGRSSSKN
jgi:hypothetical protein